MAEGGGERKLFGDARRLIWKFWKSQTRISSTTNTVLVGSRHDNEIIVRAKHHQQVCACQCVRATRIVKMFIFPQNRIR